MPLHFLLTAAAGALPDERTAAGVGDDVVLTGAEAHHAATVRRVRIGEEVTVGDGRGTWLTGESIAVGPREVIVRVTRRVDVPAPSPRLVLVQALAKGDRDELAVQAATELGVDEIVPWQALRSVSRWDAAKAEKGRIRWAGIVREAAKQAHRAWLPEVAELARTRDLTARTAASRVLVLEPAAAQPLTALDFSGDAPSDPPGDADILLVVGPEGGIDPEELDALTAAGATPVRLGETVLRTSTAGPAAISVLSAVLGRW